MLAIHPDPILWKFIWQKTLIRIEWRHFDKNSYWIGWIIPP
jgi:hypothetical protein